MNFATLPNLLALSILVAVFWAISRKATTERLYLWLAGWVLVLLHFVAQFLTAGDGLWSRIMVAIGLDCLVLAGAAFLISVSEMAWTHRQQVYLALAITIPAVAYTNGVIWEISRPAYYYCWIVAAVAAPAVLFLCYQRQIDLAVASVSVIMVAGTAIAAWRLRRGDADSGIDVVLAVLYLAAATLYWNRYRRGSAGVLTTVGGFVLWAAVFPTAAVLEAFMPSAKVESEVWNIPKYLVAVGMILTLLEDQIEKSKYLAYHDELTGLPNRRLLEDRLSSALARANRTGSKVAVLQLDLDHFKEVNDTFGHRAGDLALQKIVTRLASRIRSSDTLARSGGDEFTVVSYVADARGAEALVSGLESALAAPIVVEGEPMQTGLSVGLALYPDDGTDPTQLHAAADRAMYAAKRAARGASLTSGATVRTDTSPAAYV